MIVVTLALVAFVVNIGSTASAAPAPASPSVSGNKDGNAVNLSVKNGTFAVADNFLKIKNDAGKTVWQYPLSYKLEDQEFPIAVKAASNTATLTPDTNPAHAKPVPAAEVAAVRKQVANEQSQWAQPRTKKERDDQALARFNQQAAAGMTISSWVGLAVGAVVGGAIGCIGFIWAGCIPGLIGGAGLGGVVGVLVGGGGSLAVAADQYFKTINSPFKPPKR